MTRYVSPIICSIGRLPGCDPNCPATKYYPLADRLLEAKRRALDLMKNPPDLGTCEDFGANLFLNRYLDRDRNPRDYSIDELRRLLPLIVDTKTGEVVSFNDEDLNSDLYR
jgi:hypothetical protein